MIPFLSSLLQSAVMHSVYKNCHKGSSKILKSSMAACRCLNKDIEQERFNDEGHITLSSQEQIKVEDSIQVLFEHFRNRIDIDPECPVLYREQHVQFLKKGLCFLSQSYECLDASRPWMCYWILHSLELLDEKVSDAQSSGVCEFLARCQHPDGGFGGGPGQVAHLAPTYAAVNALCILKTEEAYRVINRSALQAYLFRMRTAEGAFKMHDGGEVDIRGAYCAVCVATLTNIVTPELFDKTPEWIVSCQTYEGGFSGSPGMEAHGGYTFCGLAALVILRKEILCDLKLLLRWSANRQMRFEGGFQGRTNKLVDGCYSFWQGGVFPLLHRMLNKEESITLGMEKWLFHQGALQEYLLICCQYSGGGLIDKPGKNRDFYHTCYTLSGLSVAQHFAGGKLGSTFLIGGPQNELVPTHPVYNVCVEAVVSAHEYFYKLPPPAYVFNELEQSNGT